MSNNPQWNSFQSHMFTNDTSVLKYKSFSSSNTHYTSSNNFPPYNFQPTAKRPNGVINNADNFSMSKFDSMTFDKPSSVNNFPPIDVFNAELFTNEKNISSNSINRNHSLPSNDSSNNQGTRETGIIEKLLHSYGFIQCCERQARLFFHFSQFGGNIEHLKIGDPVEFEMTYDRRTGKPIASIVTKIAPEVVLREERVTGIVTSEVSPGETQGRITYENKGECFFLPFCKDDVEGNVTLRTSDQVSFQIATNNKGNLSATHVRLENAAHPVKYQGVICSLNDGYGAIERADVVKEIFFHEQDCKYAAKLKPGDDVEFNIQMKNGKEIACNIEKLPSGSVVFEDISDICVKGQVLKPFEKDSIPRERNDPLPGRIKYRAPDYSEVEVSFGEKDQKGDFTLRHGDWVEFRIATDRRDQLRRATCISLLEDSFIMSGERREQGTIDAIDDDGVTGFLQSAERDLKIPFKLTEILDVERDPAVGDEVEFTITQDPSSVFSNNSRQIGIRVKYLPQNSVKFDVLIETNVEGVVIKLPFKEVAGKKIVVNSENAIEIGLINCLINNSKETVKFTANDCDSLNNFQLDNKVKFDLYQVKRNKEFVCKNVRVIVMPVKPVIIQNNLNNSKNCLLNRFNENKIHQGFIAALKDGYGFIETLSLDREMFFHFSNVDGVAALEVGTEVEYRVGTRNTSSNHNMVAENVCLLPPGTIKLEGTVNEDQPQLNGIVRRPLRSLNPDQKEYAGLIQEVTDGEDDKNAKYKFGIYGLRNKSELLQIGDPVRFQVDSSKRAVNIVALRNKSRAVVESMKDQFGFLSYVVDEGRKLFFHTSQVKDKKPLQPGDLVEFVLVTNHRSGKSSAYNVSKISDSNSRPERLINRLKLTCSNVRKVIVTRQPKGPENSHKGFSKEYQRWRNNFSKRSVNT